MARVIFRMFYIFILTLEFELLAKQFLFCSADERLDNVPELSAGQSLGSNEGYGLDDETVNEDGADAEREALVEKKANSIKEAIKREIEVLGREAEPSTGRREFHEAVQAQRAAMDAYARSKRKRKRALASARAEESDSPIPGNIEEKRELPPYLFDSFQKARGALNGRQRSKRYDHEIDNGRFKKDEDTAEDDSESYKDIDDE